MDNLEKKIRAARENSPAEYQQRVEETLRSLPKPARQRRSMRWLTAVAAALLIVLLPATLMRTAGNTLLPSAKARDVFAARAEDMRQLLAQPEDKRLAQHAAVESQCEQVYDNMTASIDGLEVELTAAVVNTEKERGQSIILHLEFNDTQEKFKTAKMGYRLFIEEKWVSMTREIVMDFPEHEMVYRRQRLGEREILVEAEDNWLYYEHGLFFTMHNMDLDEPVDMILEIQPLHKTEEKNKYFHAENETMQISFSFDYTASLKDKEQILARGDAQWETEVARFAALAEKALPIGGSDMTLQGEIMLDEFALVDDWLYLGFHSDHEREQDVNLVRYVQVDGYLFDQRRAEQQVIQRDGLMDILHAQPFTKDLRNLPEESLICLHLGGDSYLVFRYNHEAREIILPENEEQKLAWFQESEAMRLPALRFLKPVALDVSAEQRGKRVELEQISLSGGITITYNAHNYSSMPVGDFTIYVDGVARMNNVANQSNDPGNIFYVDYPIHPQEFPDPLPIRLEYTDIEGDFWEIAFEVPMESTQPGSRH